MFIVGMFEDAFSKGNVLSACKEFVFARVLLKRFNNQTETFKLL